jgi:hypothetical protein
LAFCNCDLSWFPFVNSLAEIVRKSGISKKRPDAKALRLKGGGFKPGDGE